MSRPRPPAEAIVETLTEMGVTLDPDLVRLDAVHQRLWEELDGIQRPSERREVREFLDSLGHAHPEQITDEFWWTAQRAAATDTALKLRKEALKALASEITHGVITAYAEIYAPYQARFAAAVAELAELVALLGARPDAEQVFDGTDADREAYARRQQVLREVSRARHIDIVMRAAGFGSGGHIVYSVLDPTQDYTWDQLAQAEDLLDEYQGDVSGLLDAGYSLALNPPDIAAAIPAWAAAEEAKRAAAEAKKAPEIDPEEEASRQRQLRRWNDLAAKAEAKTKAVAE